MQTAPIDRVRVFQSGARVTRTMHVQGPFPRHVEVQGLPLSLVDATVTVRCAGDEGVAGTVQVGLHASPPEALEDAPDRLALRTARRELERNELALQAIEAECAALGELDVRPRPTAKGQRPSPSPMRARVALERFTDGAVRTRRGEMQVLRARNRTLETEIRALEDAVRRQEDAGNAHENQVTKTVIVEVRSNATTVQLEVAYFVPGARWAPQYQVRLTGSGTRATVHTRAIVTQNTGESWENIRLELSTAAPQSFSVLPRLAARRVGRRQPTPPARGFRPPPVGGASLFADFDRGVSQTRGIADAAVFVRAAPSHMPLVPFGFGGGGMAAGAAGADFESLEEECDEYAVEDALPPAPPKVASPRRQAKKRAAPRTERSRKPEAPRQRRPPAYHLLRLAAPDDPARGTLEASGPQHVYSETLQRSGLRVGFDPMGLVRRAYDQARSTRGVAFPPGTIDVAGASGHFDYTYRAEDRVDIPSDRSIHSVPLETREARTRLRYVVVPRLDTHVFRVASIDNPTDAPLLQGPVEVYVDGTFVLSSVLPTVAPRERFELGLGVEQAIRCTRNTRFQEERSTAAVVAMSELRHAISVEVHNPFERPIDVEVRECIPTPAEDAEVVVVEHDVEPPWAPWTPDDGPLDGGRMWSVEVPPQTHVALEARYTVQIYANNELVGGNRREA